MVEEKIKDWRSFRSRLLDYSALDLKRRRQLIFRGQPDSRLGLLPTLDRTRSFETDRERDQYIRDLLEDFRREVIGLGGRSARPNPAEGLELLARHHGLPSPLLDWTESPYIGAFFAFQEPAAPSFKSVAIWVLDLAKFVPGEELGVDVIRDPDLIRFNRRALRQRGVFLKVGTLTPVEKLLDEALTKFVLPASSRQLALADLDAMRINAVELFRDLDAAARTATYRVSSDTSQES